MGALAQLLIDILYHAVKLKKTAHSVIAPPNQTVELGLMCGNNLTKSISRLNSRRAPPKALALVIECSEIMFVLRSGENPNFHCICHKADKRDR